jgi:hypothetical protein
MLQSAKPEVRHCSLLYTEFNSINSNSRSNSTVYLSLEAYVVKQETIQQSRSQKKHVYTLNAHNSHVNNDGILVFYRDKSRMLIDDTVHCLVLVHSARWQ